jgi:hypothetical protein
MQNKDSGAMDDGYRPLEEWPPWQKAQRGKKLLADFLQTPAHLEVVRHFSKLWRPFRFRIDGAILLSFISRGGFPEWFHQPQSHRVSFTLKKMDKIVNTAGGRKSVYQPKAMQFASLPPIKSGRELLADFLQTPAHLVVVRIFSKLWWPYRKVLDGELLMGLICRNEFPETFWQAARLKSNAA